MSDIRADRSLRVVVAAGGDDATARLKARALLMNGYEVVFIGGHQSPDQIAWTAVAEDAGSVVVDAPATFLRVVGESLSALTSTAIDVQTCAQDQATAAGRLGEQSGTDVRHKNRTE